MSIERSLSHTHVHIDGLHSSIVEYKSTSSMQVIRAPTVNESKKNVDIDTTKVVGFLPHIDDFEQHHSFQKRSDKLGKYEKKLWPQINLKFTNLQL